MQEAKNSSTQLEAQLPEMEMRQQLLNEELIGRFPSPPPPSPVLIAGVHNSLSRAVAVAKQQTRAVNHFEKAVGIGTPASYTRLITQTRINQQIFQNGSYDSKQTRLEYCCESESFLKKHLIDRNLSRNKPIKRNLLRYTKSSENQSISNNKSHQFSLMLYVITIQELYIALFLKTDVPIFVIRRPLLTDALMVRRILNGYIKITTHSKQVFGN